MEILALDIIGNDFDCLGPTMVHAAHFLGV